MGFCLTDLGDESCNVFVNFWNWRPTVELIGSFEILDKERLELIGEQCLGTKVFKEEARQIGIQIREQILPDLTDEQRILLDLTSTIEPNDSEFHQGEDSHKNYSTSRKWLEKFSEFCLTCDGFSVL